LHLRLRLVRPDQRPCHRRGDAPDADWRPFHVLARIAPSSSALPCARALLGASLSGRHSLKEASMFHGLSLPWFGRSCTTLLVFLAISCSQFQRADPLVGTWTLNLQRSKFSPVPAPKNITVTYEQTTNGLHVVSIVELPDGSNNRSEYTAGYDGKDYPITGVSAVETVSMRQIDALTTERVDKKA